MKSRTLILSVFAAYCVAVICGCVSQHQGQSPARAEARTKLVCSDDFILTHMADSTVIWTIAIPDKKGKNSITQILDAFDGSTYVLGWYADSLWVGTRMLYAKNKNVFLTRILADGTVAWITSYGGSDDDAPTFIRSFYADSCSVVVFRGAYDTSGFPCPCEEYDPLARYTGIAEFVTFRNDNGSCVRTWRPSR